MKGKWGRVPGLALCCIPLWQKVFFQGIPQDKPLKEGSRAEGGSRRRGAPSPAFSKQPDVELPPTRALAAQTHEGLRPTQGTLLQAGGWSPGKSPLTCPSGVTFCIEHVERQIFPGVGLTHSDTCKK